MYGLGIVILLIMPILLYFCELIHVYVPPNILWLPIYLAAAIPYIFVKIVIIMMDDTFTRAYTLILNILMQGLAAFIFFKAITKYFSTNYKDIGSFKLTKNNSVISWVRTVFPFYCGMFVIYVLYYLLKSFMA